MEQPPTHQNGGEGGGALRIPEAKQIGEIRSRTHSPEELPKRAGLKGGVCTGQLKNKGK